MDDDLSISWGRRRSESARPQRVRVRWVFRSCSPRVRRITCTAAGILKTRSSGSRLTRKREPEGSHAPGMTSKEEIATRSRSVDRPVNVLMGLGGRSAKAWLISRRLASGGSALAAVLPELPSAPFYALREKCANTVRLLSQKTRPAVAKSCALFDLPG